MRYILALVLASAALTASSVAMHDRGECGDICQPIAEYAYVNN